MAAHHVFFVVFMSGIISNVVLFHEWGFYLGRSFIKNHGWISQLGYKGLKVFFVCYLSPSTKTWINVIVENEKVFMAGIQYKQW